jgi:hypothetical protein
MQVNRALVILRRSTYPTTTSIMNEGKNAPVPINRIAQKQCAAFSVARLSPYQHRGTEYFCVIGKNVPSVDCDTILQCRRWSFQPIAKQISFPFKRIYCHAILLCGVRPRLRQNVLSYGLMSTAQFAFCKREPTV